MPEGPPGRPARPILIVDDDPDVAGVLAAILAEDGRDAAIARDGQEALALARAAPPALILLDMLLPDLDGLEVCHRLQADPATAGIPIVFLTGTPTALAGDRLAGCAHRGILRKPVGLDELLATVERHLAG
jgi:CheY-like chemotaxis protein